MEPIHGRELRIALLRANNPHLLVAEIQTWLWVHDKAVIHDIKYSIAEGENNSMAFIHYDSMEG